MIRFFSITCLLLLCLLGEVYAQKKIQQKIPEKTRILFVMDASGSMNAAWENNISRMDAAKSILTRLVDSLRSNENLEIALRVYGHRYPRNANNCQDSRLEVPFGAKNHNAIMEKIKSIRPLGTTPITYSITEAAKDFSTTAGYRNILILITDGIESCGGDPCAASIELQKRGVFLRPYIIGLGLKAGEALNCVGQFFNSESTEDFHQVLNKTIENSFLKTTVSVKLLDGARKPTVTNINVSFMNSMTGTAVYDFVHYLDRNGNPDTVSIDPVLGYDIVVNTLPATIRKNVRIINGRHNVIEIPATQGKLVIKQEARKDQATTVVREQGKQEILTTQIAGDEVDYLTGNYQLETITLPRRKYNVKIEEKKTTTITIPAPGLVNLNTIAIGYGDLYEILEGGEQVWVCSLSDKPIRQSYTLLPGTYKAVFRVRETTGSKYTGTRTFTLKSGETATVNIFN